MSAEQKSAMRWLVLIVLVVGTAMLNYSNMIFSSRPVDMMAKYGMDQAKLTAVTTIGTLPGALFSVILGNFFDKRGGKAVRYVGALLLALAAMCMLWRVFVSSYVLLLVITFLAGTLFLPTQVLPAKMIQAWFSREESGIAMGIYGAAAGLGIMLAFALSNLYSTTTVALMSCFVGYALAALLWVCFGKMPAPSATDGAQAAASAGKPAGPAPSVAKVAKSKNMWLVMICGGLAASMPLLFNSYIVNAFLDKGATTAFTSMLGIVFNVSLVVGAIVQGSIVAKSGRYNPTYLVGCVGGGVCLFLTYLVPMGPASFVFLALGGLLGAGSVSINFTRIGLLPLTGDFGSENIGIAGGMNNTAMGLCMFGVPTIAAALLGNNYVGIFTVVLVAFVAMGLVGGVATPELGERGKLAQRAREGADD